MSHVFEIENFVDKPTQHGHDHPVGVGAKGKKSGERAGLVGTLPMADGAAASVMAIQA